MKYKLASRRAKANTHIHKQTQLEIQHHQMINWGKRKATNTYLKSLMSKSKVIGNMNLNKTKQKANSSLSKHMTLI